MPSAGGRRDISFCRIVLMYNLLSHIWAEEGGRGGIRGLNELGRGGRARGFHVKTRPLLRRHNRNQPKAVGSVLRTLLRKNSRFKPYAMIPLLAIAPTMPIPIKSTGKKRARNAATLLAVALFAPKAVAHLVRHIRTILVHIGKMWKHLFINIFSKSLKLTGEAGWKSLARLASQIWTIFARALRVREFLQGLIFSFIRRFTFQKSSSSVESNGATETGAGSTSVLGSCSCSLPLGLFWASRRLDVQVTWSRVNAPAPATSETSASETSTSTPNKKIVLRSQSPSMALDALALYSTLGHAQGTGSQEALSKARIVNGLREEDAVDTIAAVPAPQNL